MIFMRLATVAATATVTKPPHLILVVADDLGWADVGWRNEQMLTPTLDRLASEGKILANYYVHVSNTSRLKPFFLTHMC